METTLRKLKYVYTALTALGVFAFLALAITVFWHRSADIEAKKIEDDLLITTVNNVNTINFLFAEFAKTLSIGSRGLEKNPNNTNPSLISTHLHDIKTEGGFLCVSLYTPDGMMHTACDITAPQEEKSLLTEYMYSNAYISDAYFDTLHEEYVVSVSVAMQDPFNGHYLNGIISTKELSQMLAKSFFTSGGFFHIIDGNGEYLATSETGVEILMDESFIDAMPLVTFVDGYDYETTSTSFLSGKSAMTKYSYEGNIRYMYYMPVGINNWMITSVVPKEEIEKNAVSHQTAGITLTSSILAVIILLFIFIFYVEKKSQADALMMQNSIQTLADITNKVIIEWDHKKNILSAVSDYATIFGRELITRDIRNGLGRLDLVHPDDIKKFQRILKNMVDAKTVFEERFRLQHADGRYIWCELSSTVVKSPKDIPLKTFAFLENIDDDIRHTEELRKTAERDSLTDVFNKTHTESLIAYELNHLHDKIAALFILDCDNFKQINDTFGHLKGDEVLKEAANGLKHIFRSDDIIGRIGGDEFFVYLKNVDSIDSVEKKAQTVCEKLQKTYTSNNKSVTITYSIGIALAPAHGTDLETLYTIADKALYSVKSKGKNNYTIFKDS